MPLPLGAYPLPSLLLVQLVSVAAILTGNLAIFLSVQLRVGIVAPSLPGSTRGLCARLCARARAASTHTMYRLRTYTVGLTCCVLALFHAHRCRRSRRC